MTCKQDIIGDTFEFAYNAGCAYLNEGTLASAEKYLKLSEGKPYFSLCMLKLDSDSYGYFKSYAAIASRNPLLMNLIKRLPLFLYKSVIFNNFKATMTKL